MSFVPGNDKTICIAFPNEEHYQVCMNDKVKIREYLDYTYSQHPELFPDAFKGGYVLHGFVYSKKSRPAASNWLKTMKLIKFGPRF